MKILDRYLGSTVAWSTLLVMLVLLSLFLFIDFVEELEDIGKRNYSLSQAVRYILLTQPSHIYELFPLGALLGSLIGLGLLASNSELIVMRAAGVSLGRVVMSIMKVGLVMMAAAVLIGELIAPITERHAQSQRSLALTDRIALKTDFGLWTKDGTSFINIRNILSGYLLSEIYIYEFDGGHRLQSVNYADKARYEDGKWLLEGIIKSRIDDQGVTTQRQEQAAWESLLSPALIELIAVEPEQLSTWELHRYIDYLRDNGQNAARYELAFWSKIISPLVIAVMLLISVPFVFGPLRSVGMGQRILVGCLVGLGFYILNQTITQASLVYNLNPAFGAAFTPVVFFFLALALMRRAK